MKQGKENSLEGLQLDFCENIQNAGVQVSTVKASASVFREEQELTPIRVSDSISYMPWGRDNQMPFHILDLIEADETLSTCQAFNAEVCYGAGLHYNTSANNEVQEDVTDFIDANNIPAFFLGQCQDMMHFAFCVSVIILSKDRKKIVRVIRKEAMYCRFAPEEKNGKIPYIIYANWRKSVCAEEDMEVINLLDMHSPWDDLKNRIAKKNAPAKFAVVSKLPTADSTYYPIPTYGALFRGKWYDIKQLIGVAKAAKLSNSAPISYHVEIAKKYWEELIRSKGITDKKKQQEAVNEKKEEILKFLTKAENAGKAWFSTFYQTPDGKEQHEIIINKVDTTKSGGEWESDIAEAINMFCFTMRVHSNLVGSVPGKTQSNNSGSDKRELYTIAQALKKPYRDILFTTHKLICRFNGWKGVYPECPFIQLTTLDEHQDAKKVTMEGGEDDE